MLTWRAIDLHVYVGMQADQIALNRDQTNKQTNKQTKKTILLFLTSPLLIANLPASFVVTCTSSYLTESKKSRQKNDPEHR